MTQFIENHTIEEMVKSITSYLPGGDLFIAAQISGTNQNDLLRGIGFTLLDAENFIQVYNSEFIPDNTNAFIEEWESALGIPDTCFPGSEESDLSVRRLHILVKLASLGVQTVDDFVNLATIMGFPDTEVIPGVDFGVLPIEDARFTIVIRFPVVADTIFPLDFPIPFGTDQYAIMECLFGKLKPANCTLQFEFVVPIPILELPLISDTEISIGTGSSTFSRSSSGSFIDKNDGRIKFVGNNVARFENDRYLTEGPFTNLLIRVEEFDNAAWSKDGDVTITADDTGSPDGTLDADLYSNSGNNRELDQSFVIADPEDRTYTFALYPNFDGTLTDFELILRRGDGSDGNTEVHNSATGLQIGLDGWRRQEVVQTFSSSTTGNDVVCVFAPETGDTGDIHIFGAQLVELPFMPSYLKTEGSTVTKAADSLSIPVTDNITLPGADHSISFTIDALGIGTGITQTIYNFVGETTRRANINASGNLEVFNGDLHTYSLSSIVSTDSKIAITFSGTTEKVYQDGALITSNTKTIATGTATAIFIGSTDGSTDPAYIHVQRFKYFPKELDLAEIQALP